ncbi:cell division protein FtsZ [Andreprevotia lacus DSM 23236]|jgi:cell division protein FtsZ|uniref:Cell division protein FtsZ n=1 Tax=Andreprevotia lacus DSM 23236 TaxID=1121001 RepID=A0A1W1XS24_9NEIS|nr:cell division protein FtsZ [Andreprevotia lacus]SMC26664.1 cell division protein FtsZ [Andreprevotia lacus DSM 23236]
MALTIEVQEVAHHVNIKVIGVGGAGCNAINNMIEHAMSGVQFISANTDAQVLKLSKAQDVVQLGHDLTKGFGAGCNPDIGRAAAEEDREHISDLINGADLLFITAGMGGGTGTGAAPVIAQVAREKGILTVGVVTKPGLDEGNRQKVAQQGIDELSRYVDSLIVVSNQKLEEVLGEDVTIDEAFRAADDVLRNAVGSIVEIINYPGLINVDFADVKTVMREMGMAMMGSALASGSDRAVVATEEAIRCPLLDNINFKGARGVLVNFSASRGTLKKSEIRQALEIIEAGVADGALVKHGVVYDESLGDEIRVTLVATGLNGKGKPELSVVPTQALKTGTDHAVGFNAEDYDTPAIWRSRRGAAPAAEPAARPAVSNIDMDIPAFLRRQAD